MKVLAEHDAWQQDRFGPHTAETRSGTVATVRQQFQKSEGNETEQCHDGREQHGLNRQSHRDPRRVARKRQRLSVGHAATGCCQTKHNAGHNVEAWRNGGGIRQQWHWLQHKTRHYGMDDGDYSRERISYVWSVCFGKE